MKIKLKENFLGEIINDSEDNIEIKVCHIVRGALKDKKIVLESKLKMHILIKSLI